MFPSESSDDDVSDCQRRLHLGHRRRPPLLHPHGRRAQRQHRESNQSSFPTREHTPWRSPSSPSPHLPALARRPNAPWRAAPPTLRSASSTPTCSTCRGRLTPCAPCSQASTGFLRYYYCNSTIEELTTDSLNVLLLLAAAQRNETLSPYEFCSCRAS